jgi:hypothetical protein
MGDRFNVLLENGTAISDVGSTGGTAKQEIGS